MSIESVPCKQLDDSKLRKTFGVTDISLSKFIRLSAFINRRSRALHGDLSIVTWAFLTINEICECILEDLFEHIMGGGTFKKWVQFRPCSMNEIMKIKREKLLVFWYVAEA